MTATRQHKIGSGFTADSTAAEVLAGVDLDGALAVVTGGYSGLGLETTTALANAGARVVVPARRAAAAAEVLSGIDGVQVDDLDLGDQDSVRGFADRFLASRRGIDIMIDSAGIMACPLTRVGPGWEAQFGTNHLGHFALVNRLWPAVNDNARVVSVSSRGHHRSDIRWHDPHFAHDEYDKWAAYGQAKTANVLFAVQLDALASDRGVRAFSLHPGGILTPLQRHIPLAEQIERGWRNADGSVSDQVTFKTPEQGAATQVWAATSPQLAKLGGVYLEDCDVAEVAEEGEDDRGVRAYAIDEHQAARLWEFSAELTGVNAFA